MMDGYDMGSGGWIAMILVWSVVLVGIVWAIGVLPSRRSAAQPGPAERPQDILDRRLASGEIDTGTYDHLRAKLVEGDTER